jgi:predicted  nucleic acid-binding Zn-ribbon protein
MASFFKKALGVFVEFDEEKNQDTTPASSSSPQPSSGISRAPIDHAEAQKFEKYFDRLFDQANFPGPDYYEFYKMMETLEAHIHDEKARLSATYASLAIQGLTKKTLIETATKYKAIIEKDKTDFDRALNEKLKSEVGERQSQLQELEKKIAANAEQIQKLTKEITEAQVQTGKLKNEVMEEENRLRQNSNGYQLASQAVINKIVDDIQKIQSTL